MLLVGLNPTLEEDAYLLVDPLVDSLLHRT